MLRLRNFIIAIIIAALFAGIFIYALNLENEDETSEPESVIINEFMAANNSTLTDENGDFSDWIEVYNPTDAAVKLFSFGLSDDSSKVKWTFPDISLQPGEFLVVFATNEATNSKNAAFLHTGFKLSASKDAIYLTNSTGQPVDSIEFSDQLNGVSLGRDENLAWTAQEPTPGFSNDAAGRAAFLESRKTYDEQIIITEVMSANRTTIADSAGKFHDYIEIYNKGETAVSLLGYSMSDDPKNIAKWKFPDVTIGAKEYILVFASGYEESMPGGDIYANFRISSLEEKIVISNYMGIEVDSVVLREIKTDWSYSRTLSEDASYGDEWYETDMPTPLQDNNSEGFSQYMQTNEVASGDIIINEIMAANDSGLQEQDGEFYDWIELHNRGDAAVNLAGYSLSDDQNYPSKWKFDDFTLGVDEYIVVMASGDTQTESDEVKKNYIHVSFRLSGQGEVLTLYDDNGILQDRYNIRAAPQDVSIGRVDGHNELFYFDEPSPSAANNTAYAGILSTPTSDVIAGIYASEQTITIFCDNEQAKLYYTLDASVPNQSDKAYTVPITMSETGMIRAKAFIDGEYLPSAAYSATYIIGKSHELPIISLIAEDELLYSEENGIFATGYNASETFPYPGANFWQDWEIPAYFEIIEDGAVIFGQDVGLKVFGAYSRAIAQKGMSIFARNEYGDNTLSYEFFENNAFTDYKSVVFRSGGQDGQYTKVRDALQTWLISEAGLKVSVMDFKPYVIYINGEYRGVYNMREKINKYYFAQHFDIDDPDSIDLLVGNGKTLVGDSADYSALIEYCRTHDLSIQENFDYVASLMDVDSYMDFCVAEIFFSNSDLGNIKFWKGDAPGDKWQWVVYDMDWGMYKVARNATKLFFNPDGRGVNGAYSTELSVSMIENDAWRQAFLERFAQVLETTFTVSNITAKIDEMLLSMESERLDDREITGQSQGNYEAHLKRLMTFAENRQDVVVDELKTFFGLTDSETIAIFGKVGRSPTQWEIDTYGS